MSGEVELCGAFKRGVVDLTCERLKDHKGQHQATYTDERTVTYPGACHKVTTTEEVAWDPVDHVREAVERITAARKGGAA